jgi:hypothetical protein
MSETWTSLLSGVVGAIVGGAASLAGTVLVNKRQMATNARMRLYDELLPRLERAIDELGREFRPVVEEQMPELLSAVRRAGAIAGRQERRAVHRLALLWSEYESETALPPIPDPLLAIDELGPIGGSAEEPTPEDKPRQDPYAERQAKAEALLSEFRKEVRGLSDHLAAKLG